MIGAFRSSLLFRLTYDVPSKVRFVVERLLCFLIVGIHASGIFLTLTKDRLKLFYLITVPLGSIPELPADSCKEIKSSEGGQAVSTNYWLDPTRSENSILALCNMKSECECNKYFMTMQVWSIKISKQNYLSFFSSLQLQTTASNISVKTMQRALMVT